MRINCANCGEVKDENEAIKVSDQEFKIMQVTKGKTLFCVTSGKDFLSEKHVCVKCCNLRKWRR